LLRIIVGIPIGADTKLAFETVFERINKQIERIVEKNHKQLNNIKKLRKPFGDCLANTDFLRANVLGAFKQTKLQL
jgi:hypothetical protein